MKKIVDFIDKTPVTKFFSSILIMVMALVMTMNVVTRYVFHFSFGWGDEILRYMCIYMSFLGIAAGFRTGEHIGVTLFVEKLFPEKSRKYFRLLSDIITIFFLCLLVWFGIILCKQIVASHQVSPALKVPMYFIYGIVPLTAAFSVLQMLVQIFRHKTYLQPRE